MKRYLTSFKLSFCKELELVAFEEANKIIIAYVKKLVLEDELRLYSLIRNKTVSYKKIKESELKGHLYKYKIQIIINDFSQRIEKEVDLKKDKENKLLKDLFIFIAQKALAQDASDIHIEPKEKDYLIRFRIDGVLQNFTRLSKDIAKALISYIKLACDLDLDLTKIAQDASFSLAFKKYSLIDFRVSAIPLIFGQSLVLRILRRLTKLLDIYHLELGTADLALLKASIKKPWGFILISGPTGSGKSTTLYAALQEYKNSDKKIITIEDPIEQKLANLEQILLNKKAEFSFEVALKYVLRHDPDVIMIGEIRDELTLDTALKASNTGHLVYSTIHTNDSISTISRLLDMGAKPYALESCLKLIIAQRLFRRLCDCKEKEELDTFFGEYQLKGSFFKAKGCDKCALTGYKGRLLVAEFLPIDKDIKDLIAKKASYSEILSQAKSKGFLKLAQKAILKLEEGLLSMDEMKRVLAL